MPLKKTKVSKKKNGPVKKGYSREIYKQKTELCWIADNNCIWEVSDWWDFRDPVSEAGLGLVCLDLTWWIISPTGSLAPSVYLLYIKLYDFLFCKLPLSKYFSYLYTFEWGGKGY